MPRYLDNGWRGIPLQEGYPARVLLAIDELCNVILGGELDETLSSRCGRAFEQDKLWAIMLAPILNFFFYRHTQRAILHDTQRAEALLLLYGASLPKFSFSFPQQAYWFRVYTLCVWGEARGESELGKIAVAWTVRNRATRPSWWGGPSFTSVILKPFQYSFFNNKDTNNLVFPTPDSVWLDCVEVVDAVCSGSASDPTGRATHYYDTSIAPPVWVEVMVHTVDIGRLRFYR